MLSELYRPQEERIILVCVSTHLWLALISLHAAEDVLNLTLDVLLWRAGSGGQYLSSQPSESLMQEDHVSWVHGEIALDSFLRPHSALSSVAGQRILCPLNLTVHSCSFRVAFLALPVCFFDCCHNSPFPGNLAFLYYCQPLLVLSSPSDLFVSLRLPYNYFIS